jgi:hypothetical protein
MYTLQGSELISRHVREDRSCRRSFTALKASIRHQTTFPMQFNLIPHKSRSADLQLPSGSSLHSENVLNHTPCALVKDWQFIHACYP